MSSAGMPPRGAAIERRGGELVCAGGHRAGYRALPPRAAVLAAGMPGLGRDVAGSRRGLAVLGGAFQQTEPLWGAWQQQGAGRNWGIMFQSSSRPDSLRTLFKKFLYAQLPDGATVLFRSMIPGCSGPTWRRNRRRPPALVRRRQPLLGRKREARLLPRLFRPRRRALRFRNAGGIGSGGKRLTGPGVCDRLSAGERDARDQR